MKVGELKELLRSYDDDMELLVHTQHTAHCQGADEHWTSYNTVESLNLEVFDRKMRLCADASVDVKFNYGRLILGEPYEIPIQPHILKELQDQNILINKKKIVLDGYF